jgi:hypothetical protein
MLEEKSNKKSRKKLKLIREDLQSIAHMQAHDSLLN